MAYIYDLTDTWNAGGTTFNAIKMNVTDSASAVSSKLVSLQTNGTEHFSVTKAGVGYVSGSLQAGSGTTQAILGTKSVLFYNTSVSEALIKSADDASTFNSMGISKDVLRFLTQNTERMRIDGSGNLLVGTTSSLGQVTISSVDNRDTIYVQANTGGSAATGVYIMPIRTAGSLRGGIEWNGTNLLYNTTSDARAKYDIVDAPQASSLIDAIQVRSFKWNADNTEQRYGFVAQELVTIAPEAVSQPKDPDEMMGVDYSKLVPMLVKEIQSLRARVAQLEGN